MEQLHSIIMLIIVLWLPRLIIEVRNTYLAVVLVHRPDIPTDVKHILAALIESSTIKRRKEIPADSDNHPSLLDEAAKTEQGPRQHAERRQSDKS
jgi:hypothetical protein